MKKVLDTITEVTERGVNVDIFTYYKKGNVLEFEITDEVKKVGGVNFLENELLYKNVGFDDVRFFVNSRGELIVDNKSQFSFEINSEGYLEMSN